MADFFKKTKFSVGGESYLLSTVRLHWYYKLSYETMLFKFDRRNEVSYKDLYCQYRHDHGYINHRYTCYAWRFGRCCDWVVGMDVVKRKYEGDTDAR